jgi:hypothetical protein
MYCQIRGCPCRAKYNVNGKSVCGRHCRTGDRSRRNLVDSGQEVFSDDGTYYAHSEADRTPGTMTPEQSGLRRMLAFAEYSDAECQTIQVVSSVGCQTDKVEIITPTEEWCFPRPLKLLLFYLILILVIGHFLRVW